MFQRGFGSLAMVLVIVGVLIAALGFYAVNRTLLSQNNTAHPATEITNTPGGTTTTTTQSGATSSVSVLGDACAPPFDATTTVGNSFFEIKQDTLYVDGHEQVASIPGSFGIPPPSAGSGFQDPNTSPCPNPSGKSTTTTLTYDEYTNLAPSAKGNGVGVIYMRDTYTPDSNGFAPTVAKLLFYGTNGKLISTMGLSTDTASLLLDGQIVYFDGSTAYFHAFDGKGGDSILYIQNGLAIYVIGNPSYELFSPDGQYFLAAASGADGIQTSCVGPQGGGASDLELVDFENGSTSQIAYDLTRAYDPVAWSKDGQTALILIGVGDQNGCFTKNVNFMTYNVVTGQSTTNQNPSAVWAALTATCLQEGFDCSSNHSWFQ